MSNAVRHYAVKSEATSRAVVDETDTLSDTRAAMDRLFAVAAKSFESMSEGNSQKFLEQSRQTGGQ